MFKTIRHNTFMKVSAGPWLYLKRVASIKSSGDVCRKEFSTELVLRVEQQEKDGQT
jgi:hypothetical protein